MQVKYTWHAVPVNWEAQGHPPASTRINIHIALRPERESALIDAVSEGDPWHPRHVHSSARAFVHVTSPFQMWCIAHLSAEQVAELVRHADTCTISFLESCLAFFFHPFKCVLGYITLCSTCPYSVQCTPICFHLYPRFLLLLPLNIRPPPYFVKSSFATLSMSRFLGRLGRRGEGFGFWG
jgi:hypothetical protein